jgi:hypothetical protein
MRTNVADGPQLPPFAGQHPPVEIRLLQQPILEEVPLDMNDSAEVAACDHGPQLKDGREKSAHVVHGEHRSVGFLDRCNHAGRLPGVHAQWFFADDVFSGC